MNSTAFTKRIILLALTGIVGFVLIYLTLCADSSDSEMSDKPDRQEVIIAKRWQKNGLLKRLNKELSQAISESKLEWPETVSVKGFWGSAVFRDMFRKCTPSELEWLAENISSYPAKLAPFVIAVEKHERIAPSVAVRLIASSDPLPTMLVAPVLTYLNSLKLKENQYQRLKLDDVSSKYNGHKTAMAVLVHVIDYKIISQWFHNKEQPMCSSTLYLFVLSELYARMPNDKKASDVMRNALSTCAKKSSQGKLVYVYHASESAPLYREILRAVLEDKQISDAELKGVLVAKESYIKEHVDLQKLSLPVARIEHIRQLLEQIDDR